MGHKGHRKESLGRRKWTVGTKAAKTPRFIHADLGAGGGGGIEDRGQVEWVGGEERGNQCRQLTGVEGFMSFSFI